MKAALVALVLTVIAPARVTLPGGMTVTAGVLVAVVEIAVAAGSVWLAVRILRSWFRLRFRAGGESW